MPFDPAGLEHPIVAAPLAGGPTTPRLAAAVSVAGGLGFLAGGYKPPDAVAADIDELRALTDRPFGLAVFAKPQAADHPDAVARYAAGLGDGAGQPKHDDDHFDAKVALAIEREVPVVSFTFGLPDQEVFEALRDADVAVWITVTTPREAARAVAAGADALVVQGVEAGGHRGTWDDAAPGDIGLLALLQLVAQAAPGTPMIATGGIATGAGIAATLAAGATAAQLGSAFMRSPEAGTSDAHRRALETGARSTDLTRAFTGRTARGIKNDFMDAHEGTAPSAYPDIHHVTAPLRAAARKAGDAEKINLWAGQAYELADEVPAAQLVEQLAADARAALTDAARRLGTS